MIFYASERKLVIRKARTKWKVTRTYKRLFDLSNRMRAAVKIDFFKGIETFKSRIPVELIYESWLSGDYDQLMRVIPWDNLHEDMDPFKARLGEVLASAGAISMEALPAPVQDEMRWDITNPRIRGYIDKHTSDLVVNVQKDTQDIIRAATTRSFTEALSPRRVADSIKDSIGLYPKLEQAAMNYRSGLDKQGVPPVRADKLEDAYRDKLLDYRAMTIARTEVRRAQNYGQLSVWKQAADNDLIDRATAKKVWIVDGKPCEICEPMDGIAVGLEEQWDLNTGDSVDIPTDSHPNCECGMELDIGDTAEKTEANTPEEDKNEA